MVAHALGYLRDVVTGERLDWMFNPEEFALTVGASYAEKTPRGASHPRGQFTGGKGRGGKITLLFLRRDPTAADIEALRRRLEALPFPDYDASGRLSAGPHPQVLQFGAWRTLRVRIDDVVLTGGPWFNPQTTTPGELRAEITWTDAPASGDLSRDDILGGA